MKKVFLFIMCIMTTGVVFAQQESADVDEVVEYTYQSTFPKNWFVQVGGGGLMYFGDHDRQCKVMDRIGPAVEIGVGKWFTPVIGVRLLYTHAGQRGATKWPGTSYDTAYGTGEGVPGKDGAGYELQFQKFNFGNIQAETMLNLSNLIYGYKAERFYSCSPYLGIGYAMVYDEPENGKRWGREATANVGIYNSFRISRHFDVFADMRAMYVNDRFDNEGGGRFGEGCWSLTAGLVYKFEKRGFVTNKVVTRTVVDETQLGEMRDKLNKLSEEYNLLKMQASQAAQNQSKTIDKELIKEITASPHFIVFPINSSVLSNEGRVNLGMLADIMKLTGTEVVYTISGQADKGTGNKELNERLSQERAQAVFDCLTKEFGISEKQLRIVANGGVDNMYYNDPSMSRSVIVRAE